MIAVEVTAAEDVVTAGMALVSAADVERSWAGCVSAASEAVHPLTINNRSVRASGQILGTLDAMAANVLGTELQPCSMDPLTGYYRDGCCNTGGDDAGIHVVCALMTDEFLTFSASMGNDLSTPMPAFGFGGLKAGDQWCLCASRWKEALDSDMAPPVYLAGTHMATLEYVTLDELKAHAIDGAVHIDPDDEREPDEQPDPDEEPGQSPSV